jgi:MFS family permease
MSVDKLASSAAPIARPSPTRVRWGILALLMAYSAMIQFHRIGITVAGNLRIMEQYQIDPVAMGWVYSAFLLVYTLCMAPGGWVIDRLGPRAALAIVGFGSALFAALTGATGLGLIAAGMVWYALILVRGLFGIIAAPIYPSCAEVTRHWFAPGRRTLANGLVTGSAPLAIAVTYPVVGGLIRRFDWPATFFLIGGFAALLAGLWSWYAMDTPHEHPWTNAAERSGIGAAGSDQSPQHVDFSWSDWRAVLSDRGLVLLTLSYSSVGYF